MYLHNFYQIYKLIITISFIVIINGFLITFEYNLAYSQSNSEDTDNENCINNQEDSVLQQTSADSDTYLNNFHFIKKFDRQGNLIDSWGNVGSKNGQFLHAHGITIDSQDNVYVSDAENCNIQKFDKDGNFITKWGTKGIGPSKFL